MNDVMFFPEFFTDKVLNEKQEKELEKRKNRKFDFGKLPSKRLTEQFREYYLEISMHLAFTSFECEITHYNTLCRFLCDEWPEIESITDVSEDDLVRSLKKWLFAHGLNITVKRKYRNQDGSHAVTVSDCQTISIMRRIRAFHADRMIPEAEKDIWDLDRLGFEIRRNLIYTEKTIRFTKISQPGLRNELKQAILFELKYLSVGGIRVQLSAFRRFSGFLKDRYPGVGSITDLNREIIEDYLAFLNTEYPGRKTLGGEIGVLHQLVDLMRNMSDAPSSGILFDYNDRPRKYQPVYRSYSEDELKRINEALADAEPQIARILFLHQMLGTRISDTLYLEQDCIDLSGDRPKIRIYQNKVGLYYVKPVNQKIIKLVQAAKKETIRQFGKGKYLFSGTKGATKPLRYGWLFSKMRKLILEKDIRDDSGELIGVDTHLFRHTYGRKLTEMHVDDLTIARLLGHNSTKSVYHYRRMGDQIIADETKKTRNTMDDILRDIIQDW